MNWIYVQTSIFHNTCNVPSMWANYRWADSFVKAPDFKEKFTSLYIDESHNTILTEYSKSLTVERNQVKSKVWKPNYTHPYVRVLLIYVFFWDKDSWRSYLQRTVIYFQIPNSGSGRSACSGPEKLGFPRNKPEPTLGNFIERSPPNPPFPQAGMRLLLIPTEGTQEMRQFLTLVSTLAVGSEAVNLCIPHCPTLWSKLTSILLLPHLWLSVRLPRSTCFQLL